MERSRPVRNRRHSRKTWPNDILHRPLKRLFTPEIKRMLKDWLVRRRDNPYPSRDEKKTLAQETGLTYTQICNWFANWRRKLKNSGKQKTKKNWGNLIKNYNDSAKGNVEQFSISSSDSIWGENHDFDDHENESVDSDCSLPQKISHQVQVKVMKKRMKRSTKNIRLKDKRKLMTYKTPNVSSLYNNYCSSNAFTSTSQRSYYQISSTVDPNFEYKTQESPYLTSTSKFKNHIIEKYFRGLDTTTHENPPQFNPFHTLIDSNNNHYTEPAPVLTGPQLSKWLESAANFTPSRENYIEWCEERNRRMNMKAENEQNELLLHQREEIEAAEALTKLAINFRNRHVDN
uniref:CSON001625 protein n=1 Tax=Culicoides sonorensis TaxID=179676 RepID=A0A336MIF1_CULSO